MKITQYGHGICSANGKLCDCATDDHSWAVTEERDRSGESDTSRFLVSGAARSLWVRTRQGMLAEAMPRVRQELASAENAILESNSMMRFLRPDLYITVLDAATADFKTLGAGVSRSRRRRGPARQDRSGCMGERFAQAGRRQADVPHSSTAIRHAGAGRVCAHEAERDRRQLAGFKPRGSASRPSSSFLEHAPIPSVQPIAHVFPLRNRCERT